MFPPLSRHSTDETKLIDIWQLFCITALIMLNRIMNLLQSHICHISISLVSVFGNAREDINSGLLNSGNIPYSISISEEERGFVLSSTILQYFYKQKNSKHLILADAASEQVLDVSAKANIQHAATIEQLSK